MAKQRGITIFGFVAGDSDHICLISYVQMDGEHSN